MTLSLIFIYTTYLEMGMESKKNQWIDKTRPQWIPYLMDRPFPLITGLLNQIHSV